MNIIKSILGLVKKQFFVKPEDKDVLIIGKRDQLRSSKEPIYNAGAVTFKSLKDEIVAGVGSGADIPQIKESSYNFLAYGNSALIAGINQTSTKFRAIPFPIKGNVDTTGIVLQVQNTSTATLHLALYKYDYTNDIWDKATEQLDINITVTGVISQNYTAPQPLSPGLYCVAFRDSNSSGQLTGLFKHRSNNKFSGNFTDMTGFYNIMESATTSYTPTMPNQITFPAANFLENNYHELFQIQF